MDINSSNESIGEMPPPPLPSPSLSLRIELLDHDGGIIYIISNNPFTEDYMTSMTEILALLLGREKKKEGLTEEQIEKIPRK